MRVTNRISYIPLFSYFISIVNTIPLQWRHNGRDGVSNHQPHDCLLNRLFRRRSKKTSKLRVTGLCVGNSPVTGEFPAQKACSAENVSIWWRHRSCHTLAVEHHAYIWQVSPQLSELLECDWNNLTRIFARSRIVLSEKFTNGALVPPNPALCISSLWWVFNPYWYSNSILFTSQNFTNLLQCVFYKCKN